MKSRRLTLATLAVVLVIAGAVWLLRKQHPDGTVALAHVGGSNQPSGKVTFRLYNDSPRALFLSRMIVESRTSNGWQVVANTEPTDPRGVDGGKSRDLVITAPPEADRWRLRVVYGKENRGPELLLTRIELAIKSRSVASWRSVGVFTGSNSVASELSR